MYQGKHEKKTHPGRYPRSKRTTVLLTCLTLLLTCIVGTTVAYLIDTADQITNTFTPAEVSCVVNESFENYVKTDVTVANTSNIPVYIRAAIVVTFQNADGHLYGAIPVAGTHYNIELNLGTGATQWTAGSDGFYYYNSIVPVGGSTADLINSCTAITTAAPIGYGLNVEIVASAIQADGMGADVDSAQDAWTTAGIASQGGQS